MRWKNGRWRLATPDRVFLEDVIVPGFLADDEIRHVLDIGVAWYTRSYPRLFAGVDYWTVDFDPAKQRIAGPQHHTLSATQLTDAFGPRHLRSGLVQRRDRLGAEQPFGCREGAGRVR